jgi:hypothetical protein
VAAFLPCCGRAELLPAAARPAQELPFGRSSGDPASQHRGGAPNSYERARGQAPLSGAFKTSKMSCCTGPGDGRPSPALEAAHMYPAGAAPLARGYGPAQEPPSRPLGYRLDARGWGSAAWRAAGWHWHSWAAGRRVGWLEVPKGSLNHLRTLTPAAGSWSACQGWAVEGKSEGSDDGGGFEAGCGLRGGSRQVMRCYAGVRALGGLVCYPRSESYTDMASAYPYGSCMAGFLATSRAQVHVSQSEL